MKQQQKEIINIEKKIINVINVIIYAQATKHQQKKHHKQD
jgi:hypothetical protein